LQNSHDAQERNIRVEAFIPGLFCVPPQVEHVARGLSHCGQANIVTQIVSVCFQHYGK